MKCQNMITSDPDLFVYHPNHYLPKCNHYIDFEQHKSSIFYFLEACMIDSIKKGNSKDRLALQNFILRSFNTSAYLKCKPDILKT